MDPNAFGDVLTPWEIMRFEREELKNRVLAIFREKYEDRRRLDDDARPADTDGLTAAGIAIHTQANEEGVSLALEELRESGFVERHDDGGWRATARWLDPRSVPPPPL